MIRKETNAATTRIIYDRHKHYSFKLGDVQLYSYSFRFINMGFFDGGWKPLDTAAERAAAKHAKRCLATTQRSDTNRCRLLRNFLASLFSPPLSYQFCARITDDGDSCRYILLYVLLYKRNSHGVYDSSHRCYYYYTYYVR